VFFIRENKVLYMKKTCSKNVTEDFVKKNLQKSVTDHGIRYMLCVS
jgi:hypothetical protein